QRDEAARPASAAEAAETGRAASSRWRLAGRTKSGVATKAAKATLGARSQDWIERGSSGVGMWGLLVVGVGICILQLPDRLRKPHTNPPPDGRGGQGRA